MSWWLEMMMFGAGYAASVYSWPAVRTFMTGIEAELVKLEDRMKALKDKIV